MWKKVIDVSVQLIETFDASGNPAFITFSVGDKVPKSTDIKDIRIVTKIKVNDRKRAVKIFYDDGIITKYMMYKFIYSIKSGGV